MTTETERTLNTWLRSTQTGVAVLALISALVYAGQRSERDEQQTRALDKMAVEMAKIQEAATQGSSEIKVLNVRMGALEERVGKIERR